LSTSGTVVEFDDAAGIGRVRDDGPDGATRFFHCTAIADGTRTIEVGAKVTYDVRPGHLGQWEAAAITPVTRVTPVTSPELGAERRA
jgi:cold shock CspA family protein